MKYHFEHVTCTKCLLTFTLSFYSHSDTEGTNMLKNGLFLFQKIVTILFEKSGVKNKSTWIVSKSVSPYQSVKHNFSLRSNDSSKLIFNFYLKFSVHIQEVNT